MTIKIYHDDNQLNVVDKVNELLKEHNLEIQYVDPDVPKDGFEEIFVTPIKKS
jgi:hypothetical protein